MTKRWAVLLVSAAGAVCGAPGASWAQAPEGGGVAKAAAGAKAPPTAEEVARRAVEFLLSAQESMDGRADKSEWPYEGVYRVGRQIPIGYRVGGTAICVQALLRAPGYAGDAARREAVARAVDFVCAQAKHPLMSVDDYDGGYDVRGWGYTYALAMLLELKARDAVPAAEGVKERVEATVRWAIDAVQRTEIGAGGGWNYARPPGKAAAAAASPFMTAPTVQALLEARRQGYAVDEAVLDRALKALERGRTATGSFVYAAPEGRARPEPVPGSVGRMLAGETTLMLAGRGDAARVRGALDAFLAHWSWLDQRRAKTGTHEGPYGVAPYYFYFAHYYAAQAIELLPRGDREEYRRRLRDLLLSVRRDDGTWNDRVFPRSAAYGTAMSAMCLLMPEVAKAGMLTVEAAREAEGQAKDAPGRGAPGKDAPDRAK